MSLGERLFDHYERFFPNCLVGREVFTVRGSDVQVLGGDVQVQVLMYDGALEGVRVFATMGLSRLALAPFEFVVAADSEWEAIPRLIVGAGVELLEHHPQVKWGHVLDGLERVDREFVARTGKSAALVTVPHWFGAEFCSVQGERGQVFLWLLAFLTADELACLQREGLDAFEERLEHADLASPHRPSTVG